MSSKAEPEASPAIGAEARQLLTLLAEKSGSSPSAVLESAIREKAQREQVKLPGQAMGNSAEKERTSGIAEDEAPPIDLRSLAARVLAGDSLAEEETKGVIAELRAMARVTPAKRPEELDPEWQDRFLALVEQLRRAVPEEWTPEQLEEQIGEAIAEVRASRAGAH